MSLPFIREFKLAGSDGDGRRAFLNEDGSFLGAGVPLLEKDAFGFWRPRSQPMLEKLFGLGYGEPIDLGSRMDRLATVAHALNKGDLCLAAIALVQMELPELPDPILAELMAKADGLRKAGYNAAEPRDDHNQKWVAAGGADAILAEAKKHGGWLSPKDVHQGNEKECVSLVRAVIPDLPHSGAWKEGEKLANSPDQLKTIPPGTAIAVFRNGRYNNTKQDHTAIYDEPDTQNGHYGIWVVDQWNGAQGTAKRRFYPFTPNGHTHFLAGQFSVIAKP